VRRRFGVVRLRDRPRHRIVIGSRVRNALWREQAAIDARPQKGDDPAG